LRYAWATDLHLDSVEASDVERFCAAIRNAGVEGLLLSGDIAISTCVIAWLDYLDSILGIPIYFVLGNHDYYGSDIRTVRDAVVQRMNEDLVYLPQAVSVSLSKSVSLIGVDGWGDCRHGDVENYELLTDYFAIRDLAESVSRSAVLGGYLQRERLARKLRELGDAEGATLKAKLKSASGKRAVVVLTHVPPFREACWHEGAISEETWLPGFTCKAVGDILIEAAKGSPETAYTVLCGHTHGRGDVELLPNLRIHTGYGDYGRLFPVWIRIDGNDIGIDWATGAV
jgi:predicted phosphohydrolase